MCKLVDHLKEPLLREAAADCIHEIITKGMDPVTKAQLIESFVTVLDQAGVLKPVDVSFLCVCLNFIFYLFVAEVVCFSHILFDCFGIPFIIASITVKLNYF